MAANLPGQLQSEWTARRILLAILTVLGVVVTFALFYRFYMVVFLFLLWAALALLVWSFALDVRWLHRQRAVSAVGSFP